jgi:PAS domain S-box-containing protein
VPTGRRDGARPHYDGRDPGRDRRGTLLEVPFYICPNCKNRSVDHDGRQGLLQQAVACERCGFGFLFELMDDYYPAPAAGLVVCDKDGRVLALGRGFFELTGYRDADLMGRVAWEALQLDPQIPKTVLEWGVRKLGEELEIRTRAGSIRPVKADFFPAYDDDGGLLIALAPR